MTHRVSAMLLAAGALAIGSCGDTTDELAVERELFNTEVAGVDGQVWVFGGVSGPDGSSPPDSSDLPDAWGPNTELLVYDLDGSLSRKLTLPLLDGQGLFWAVVVEVGDERYLLGSECQGYALGCGSTDKPLAAFRIGEVAERVDLDVPSTPLGPWGGDISRHLGQGDGRTWVEQQLLTADDFLDDHNARVLAIDLGSGATDEITLPDLVFSSVCSADGTIVAAQSLLEGEPPILAGVRLLGRPLDGTDTDWTPIADLELNVAPTSVQLLCLPHEDDVVLTLEAGGQRRITVSTDDGAIVADEPAVFAGVRLGAIVVPGTDITTWNDPLEPDRAFARRYVGDGAWGELDVEPPRPFMNPWVVVDGVLYDAGALVQHAYARSGPAPKRLLDLGGD